MDRTGLKLSDICPEGDSCNGKKVEKNAEFLVSGRTFPQGRYPFSAKCARISIDVLIVGVLPLNHWIAGLYANGSTHELPEGLSTLESSAYPRSRLM